MGFALRSHIRLMDMFNAVNSVMQIITLDASAGSNHADGDTAFVYLKSFEFVFFFHV